MHNQKVGTTFFEDAHLLVLSKPAGLLSQAGKKGDPNLVDCLRKRFGRPYVGLVHRLDRNTSGLMVVAKRTKAAQRLTLQLQQGRLVRRYRAWLRGRLEHSARWEHFLLKHEARNEVRVVAGARPGAKQAALTVTPVGYGDWRGLAVTLAELELETGRSHQIRAQAAACGFPLLGDLKYGPRVAPQHATPPAFGRPALHSFHLEFDHPVTGTRQVFEDPLPEDMRSIAISPLAESNP